MATRKPGSVTAARAETLSLEKDSAHMEKKLALLRDMIQLEEEQAKQGGGTIWKSGGNSKPIRKGYVAGVMAKRKPAPVGKARPAVDSAVTNTGKGGKTGPPLHANMSKLASVTKQQTGGKGTSTSSTPKPSRPVIPPVEAGAQESPKRVSTDLLGSLVADLYGASNPVKDNDAQVKDTSMNGTNLLGLNNLLGGTGGGTKSMGENADSSQFARAQDESTGSQQNLGNSSKRFTGLSAALQKQKDDLEEVQSILAILAIDRYFNLFEEHGFDNKETMLEMTEEHMTTLGMAIGHRIKLKKYIEKERGPPPQPVVQARSAETNTLGSNTLTSSISNGSTLKSRLSASGTIKKSVTINESPSVAPAAGTNSLLEGSYDEDAAAASFQEALMAWRQGNKATAKTNDGRGQTGGNDAQDEPRGDFQPSILRGEKRTVGNLLGSTLGTNTGEQEDSDQKFSLGSLGGSTINFIADGIGFTNVENPGSSASKKVEVENTNEETSSSPMAKSSRICCYTCYKQFLSHTGVELENGKQVCSDECFQQHTAQEKRKKEIAERRKTQLADLEKMMSLRESERGEKSASSTAQLESKKPGLKPETIQATIARGSLSPPKELNTSEKTVTEQGSALDASVSASATYAVVTEKKGPVEKGVAYESPVENSAISEEKIDSKRAVAKAAREPETELETETETGDDIGMKQSTDPGNPYAFIALENSYPSSQVLGSEPGSPAKMQLNSAAEVLFQTDNAAPLSATSIDFTTKSISLTAGTEPYLSGVEGSPNVVGSPEVMKKTADTSDFFKRIKAKIERETGETSTEMEDSVKLSDDASLEQTNECTASRSSVEPTSTVDSTSTSDVIGSSSTDKTASKDTLDDNDEKPMSMQELDTVLGTALNLYETS